MNNKQREEYFRTSDNWEGLGGVPVKDMDHASYLVIVWKLKGYNIIKIEALLSQYIPGEYNIGEHEVVLGYYEGDENSISSIYELTTNQCIAIMRRQDNEKWYNIISIFSYNSLKSTAIL